MVTRDIVVEDVLYDTVSCDVYIAYDEGKRKQKTFIWCLISITRNNLRYKGQTLGSTACATIIRNSGSQSS